MQTPTYARSLEFQLGGPSMFLQQGRSVVSINIPVQQFGILWLWCCLCEHRGPCRALAGSPQPQAPLVTQSWPLADPRPRHTVSSQAVPPSGDWEQLKLFIFSLAQVSASTVLGVGGLWIWTWPLQMHVPSPLRETIMHTLFTEKHLEWDYVPHAYFQCSETF